MIRLDVNYTFTETG